MAFSDEQKGYYRLPEQNLLMITAYNMSRVSTKECYARKNCSGTIRIATCTVRTVLGEHFSSNFNDSDPCLSFIK